MRIGLLPEPVLLAPVAYQGGKCRLADAIVANMELGPYARFFDFCCGSGAVSIAAVNAGLRPENIVMVDQGPWGIVWETIGAGAFDLDVFHGYCDDVPSDPSKIRRHMEELYQEPPGSDAAYRFLLLQAASIGGKAFGLREGRWVRGSGFRDYWKPTATSKRRSPVNPMMPMPKTIFERVKRLVVGMKGVKGVYGDASDVFVPPGSVVYIDPPYQGTTGYDFNIDSVEVAKKISQGSTAWMSEAKPVSDRAVRLSGGRRKGGITGDRKREAHEEWLSCFVKEERA